MLLPRSVFSYFCVSVCPNTDSPAADHLWGCFPPPSTGGPPEVVFRRCDSWFWQSPQDIEGRQTEQETVSDPTSVPLSSWWTQLSALLWRDISRQWEPATGGTSRGPLMLWRDHPQWVHPTGSQERGHLYPPSDVHTDLFPHTPSETHIGRC